jgi:hypothetical protein
MPPQENPYQPQPQPAQPEPSAAQQPYVPVNANSPAQPLQQAPLPPLQQPSQPAYYPQPQEVLPPQPQVPPQPMFAPAQNFEQPQVQPQAQPQPQFYAPPQSQIPQPVIGIPVPNPAQYGVQPSYAQVTAQPTKSGSKRKKVLLIAGIVLVVLIVLSTILSVALGGSKTPTYKASDVKTRSTDGYTVNYPSAWEDYTNKSIGLDAETSTSTADYKVTVYGTGYNSAHHTAKGYFAIIDSTKNSVALSDFKLYLTDATNKQAFESQLSSATDEIKRGCTNSAALKTFYDYSDPAYAAKVSFAIDCQPTKASGIAGVTHQQGFYAYGGRHTYIVLLQVAEKDWIKNRTYYETNVLNSFVPKG